MGRASRVDIGDEVYHVINRSNGRLTVFETDKDYFAFERILFEATERFRMRLLAYSIMPNHWHLVVWTREDGDLGRFVGWLTLTHTQRCHAHRGTTGDGPIYQGRYRSFLVENESYFLRLCRYVERNASRAGLASKAEKWRWGSTWIRKYGSANQKKMLNEWPVEIPDDFEMSLNHDDESDVEKEELITIRSSVNRGAPYGSDSWRSGIIKKYNLISTVRKRGRQLIIKGV